MFIIYDLIDVYFRGYCAKTSLNDLDEKEKLKIENFKKLNLTSTVDGFKINAYLAYYDNNPISLVVMLSNNIESYITKVSTIPIFRRKHVASSLMQYDINKQRLKGVQEIMLVTDKYSVNENFYAFNSFTEFGQAFALDVSDISKYEAYVKNNKL